MSDLSRFFGPNWFKVGCFYATPKRTLEFPEFQRAGELARPAAHHRGDHRVDAARPHDPLGFSVAKFGRDSRPNAPPPAQARSWCRPLDWSASVAGELGPSSLPEASASEAPPQAQLPLDLSGTGGADGSPCLASHQGAGAASRRPAFPTRRRDRAPPIASWRGHLHKKGNPLDLVLTAFILAARVRPARPTRVLLAQCFHGLAQQPRERHYSCRVRGGDVEVSP
jgi:hypothetical protein